MEQDNVKAISLFREACHNFNSVYNKLCSNNSQSYCSKYEKITDMN